ncbi:hypothetical protein J1N51_10140 [Psychrosphaera ytuae]|uniref:Uncharacterized protein n=1 Tax=Psychrosphaera ytuae TaxID=2820710 RepID=A0A975HHI3_9GAMM|nr:hypothetical protein [Psychrosphaera ytuae]QTH63102.1 hypothetical protein J1N51_10140 [Psychrosphaera ytuae]
MLKLKSSVVTKTHIGHGTYLFDNLLSETLFIPVDIKSLFDLLQQGVLDRIALQNAVFSEVDCTDEEALLVVENTIDSLSNKGLLEH